MFSWARLYQFTMLWLAYEPDSRMLQKLTTEVNHARWNQMLPKLRLRLRLRVGGTSP